MSEKMVGNLCVTVNVCEIECVWVCVRVVWACVCLSVYNPSPRGIRNHFAKLTPSETLCTRKEKAPGWGFQGQLQPLPLIPSVSLWAQSQSSQRGRASSVPGIKDSHLEACHPPGPPVQQPPWPLKPQPLTRVILSKEPTNQPVDQWEPYAVEHDAG